MRSTRAADWTPSATLPNTPVSFAGVTYAEMLDRARALVPTIAARAEACETLRRLPDDTERDLHRTGLFRMVQPARVGGADLDIGILVDTCAEVARVCPSTRLEPRQSQQPSLDAGILSSRGTGRTLERLARRFDRHLADLPGRSRPQGRGWVRSLGAMAAFLRCRQLRLEHAGLHGPRERGRPAGRPALRPDPSLAIRDYRHLACYGPLRHRLQGRGRSRTSSCPTSARSRPGR